MNPEVPAGQPILRGTRIPTELSLEKPAARRAPEDPPWSAPCRWTEEPAAASPYRETHRSCRARPRSNDTAG